MTVPQGRLGLVMLEQVVAVKNVERFQEAKAQFYRRWIGAELLSSVEGILPDKRL